MRRARWKIRPFETPEAALHAAAHAVVSAQAAAVRERGRFLLVLSGGSTPRGVHRLLTTEPFREQVDWSRVEVFWGDERPVPPDHPDSNYRMAWESLLEPLGVPARQIHRIKTEGEDLDRVAFEYQRELARVCGVAAPRRGDGDPAALPRLDLVLLGMGADGHTASLFPHTAALGDGEEWVSANPVPQLSTTRVTMTARLLNQARQLLFLVLGGDKAAALRAVVEGPQDPERLPSQLIRPVAGQVEWFVDAAAAVNLAGTQEEGL